MPMSGIDLIRAERVRQIHAKGYDLKHDKKHGSYQLAGLAINMLYPHETEPLVTDKRTLIKAGALIAAAIDTLED